MFLFAYSLRSFTHAPAALKNSAEGKRSSHQTKKEPNTGDGAGLFAYSYERGDSYSSLRIFMSSMQDLATLVPGPKMAATPAL